MLVALISDIHGHSTRLLLALTRAQELGCTHLLCMGDVDDIGTFRILCEEWSQGADIVFGNNEWHRESFFHVADEYPHVTHHGDAAAITLAGREVYFCHYPHVAARAAASGRYNAVFYGHTHRAELQEGTPLIVNPGDIQGRYGNPSMAVYNTDDNSAYLVSL